MTKYSDCDTVALLIIESGLNYYDSEIIQELANRAGLGELWESAEMYQQFEDAYAQIIMKLT
jgi:hypothetical protein